MIKSILPGILLCCCSCSVMADSPKQPKNQPVKITHIQGAVKPVNQPQSVQRVDVKGKFVAPVHLGVHHVKNYHFHYGTVFPKGHVLAGRYFYSGWNHRHWSRWAYYQSYGVNLYYCPYTLVWYYWCAPDFCYYPVSYVPYGRYNVEVNVQMPEIPEPPAPIVPLP